jgi:hypothetical protein
VVFCALIAGVLAFLSWLDSGIDKAKANLRDRGLTVTDKGVKVKTDKRFGREEYVDATQR